MFVGYGNTGVWVKTRTEAGPCTPYNIYTYIIPVKVLQFLGGSIWKIGRLRVIKRVVLQQEWDYGVFIMLLYDIPKKSRLGEKNNKTSCCVSCLPVFLSILDSRRAWLAFKNFIDMSRYVWR